MDGTRLRRTRDRARRAWYAGWRQYRFARHYGFENSSVNLETGRSKSCSAALASRQLISRLFDPTTNPIAQERLS